MLKAIWNFFFGTSSTILAEKAKANPQKLNYNESIVDLMKLLSMDSSLENRKKLAKEYGYTGTLNGSADMNMFLHRKLKPKGIFGG